MQRIGFIVFPGFQVMSRAVMAVFESANKETGEPVYDVHLFCRRTAGPSAARSASALRRSRSTADRSTQ